MVDGLLGSSVSPSCEIFSWEFRLFSFLTVLTFDADPGVSFSAGAYGTEAYVSGFSGFGNLERFWQ